MLLFLGIGLAVVVLRAVRRSEGVWRLLLVWMLIPILRLSIPSGLNFDGIRHFLEFLPAAALGGRDRSGPERPMNGAGVGRPASRCVRPWSSHSC